MRCDGTVAGGGLARAFPLGGQAETYQTPVFGMDSQGSCGGSEPSFCKSSMEILSGERTKAIRPSRGGRLMVTPACISRSQVA
jgi:hypothetical protein